jgi:hypothetical protein
VGTGPAVHEVRQSRKSADPIHEHVMHHEHEGRPSIGKSGYQHGRPQRRSPGQRGLNHRQGKLQQRRFVPRIAARHSPDMATDVELSVVDPDRAATTERRTDQPLTEPRYARKPIGDQPTDMREVESGILVEQQDHAELIRDIPAVHRQERPVSSAGTLNCR